MNKDWLTLVGRYGESGAREKFEGICGVLFKKMYPCDNVRTVKLNPGDDGIDVFIGMIGQEPIHVIQCKFFARRFGDAQKEQIRRSFKSAIQSKKYKMHKWSLCIANTLSIGQHKWWTGWVGKMTKEYNLPEGFKIELIDGDDLIRQLKEKDCYNTAFEREDSIKIDELHKSLVPQTSIDDVKNRIQKASSYLSEIKNYFGERSNTHIKRKETQQIIDWVETDLEDCQKNIFVLEGEKGMGKSVILKDVYERLVDEKYVVLGIKADKYYASSLEELENNLFLDRDISFSKIIQIVGTHKAPLIVIIDQLDALSQALSTNRSCIQTYNRIIKELTGEKNTRVILSSRTYDLNYDPALSVYKSNGYKNITASLLDENEVYNTLRQFINVSYVSKRVVRLLKTPYHLEIFCKLPNKEEIDLSTLSSLKGLYDQLWKNLVENHLKLRLSELLYDIAIKMYRAQQLFVTDEFATKFSAEQRSYLLKEGLIIKKDNDIQFFHQTFCDYCFARQFVERDLDIRTYLDENEQNLETRSTIKMVFEYLREYDPKKYISSTRSILKSATYRLHIKYLIISDLGILTTPLNDEKKLVGKYILKNRAYKDMFISSVSSKAWIEYLIERRIAEPYLFIRRGFLNSPCEFYNRRFAFRFSLIKRHSLDGITERSRNAIWTLFRNNINNAPLQIITHLDGLADFPHKNRFIERILINLDDWGDEELLPFLAKYLRFDEKTNGISNHWLYETLGKVFEYHPDYVFDLIKPDFKHIFCGGCPLKSEFSYEQMDLLKKMYEINPAGSFAFILDIYRWVIEREKDTDGYAEIDCPYYKCKKFYDLSPFFEAAHTFIEEFLIEHLVSKKSDRQYRLDFYHANKESNSIYLLRVVTLLLKRFHSEFKDEIFELVNIIASKNGFNGLDDRFQLYVSQLIGASFALFSEREKKRIIEILMSIKYPRDLRYYKDKDANGKVYFSGFGKKQYRFIEQVPIEEIKKYPELKKVSQAFYRQFGDIDKDKAMDISSSQTYVVGSPLTQNAYTHMNLKAWKSSMLKFDDNYKGKGPKGGKSEHSRAFSNEVKNHPEKFYDFILELCSDKSVSVDYISYGMNGLIEAKYEPKKVKKLYKQLIQLELDSRNTLYTIWNTAYLIDHQLIDKDILSFLIDNAKNHPNPEKPMNENDPDFDSHNTVRGSAIRKVIRCAQHREFKDIIFEAVESAVSDPQMSVRVAIIQELAYLNHLDLKRSFKLFMALTKKGDIQILKKSSEASQYFNNAFHFDMYPYFEQIIKCEELHRNGCAIVLSWLNEAIDDKRLYKRFISSSDEAKFCAIKIAEANLLEKSGEINSKSLQIITGFLNQRGKGFASAYSRLIWRKLATCNFKLFYPFLIKYAKSKLCMKEPYGFLKLLLTCVEGYPKECLILIQQLDFCRAPNIQESGYYGKEPVQLILALYSKLNMELKKNRKYVKKSLDIFDSMLKHDHLRIPANNAIELTTWREVI